MPDVQRPQYTYTSDFLRTKLVPPHLSAPMVRRHALLARLDEGLSRKLTLVTAPAGFGKTTLVAGWLDAQKEPVAWVSLEAVDGDPIRFWRYVVAACQSFDPAIDRAVLPLLASIQRSSFEPFLTPLINRLAALDGRHILVLDDYHALGPGDIHQGMAFLLEHLPQTLHIILMGRTEPPLPLGRLRVRNELSELRIDDLRFTQAEISALFKETLHVELAPRLLEYLERRTEGWGAGLRLIMLALDGKVNLDEIEPFLATFSGDQRHLMDYLLDDVLSAQPPAIQDFIFQTAALSRFTASLCDEVTVSTGSQSILDRLERDNLFLVPLGDEGAERWYRYHSLFGEAIAAESRRRLGGAGYSTADLCEALGRASRWYERHGFLIEAVDATLNGEHYGEAARLIEHLLEARSFNEPLTLRRWVERLPEDTLAVHPDVAFSYAATLLYTLDRRASATATLVEGPLRLAEQYWQREENQPKLGAVMAFRAGVNMWQGDVDRSFALARQALELLGETPSEIYWRGIALLFAGMQDLLDGYVDHAERAVMEARAIAGASQDTQAVLAATLVHAEVYLWRSQYHPAAQLYEQVIDEAVDREDPSDRPYALLGLGRIQYEWNEIALARQGVETALDIGRTIGDGNLVIEASLLLARIDFVSGRAREAHRRLDELVTTAQWPRMHRKVRTWQARFNLWSGDTTAAQRALDALAREGVPQQRMQQELEELSRARLEIALGRAEEALSRAQAWRKDALAEGRAQSEIDVLIVQALAYFSLQDVGQARSSLAEALDLAQTGEYRRLFIDEGEPMIALLKLVLAEHDEPYASYARVLLHAVMQTQMAAPEATTADGLIEPLSPQERRVLRLLAAGLSNADIANELVVSVNTIKTQLKSIYHKLSVRSREEACDAARDLHLV